jgi:hypothetical protein
VSRYADKNIAQFLSTLRLLFLKNRAIVLFSNRQDVKNVIVASLHLFSSDPDLFEEDRGRRLGGQRSRVPEGAGLPLRGAVHPLAVPALRMGHGEGHY